MCCWLVRRDAVRCVAVPDANPVGDRLHKYEPAAYFDTVACPVTVLGKLVWYDVLYSDVDFTHSYEQEESDADTIAHDARTPVVIPTVEALSQFLKQTHLTVGVRLVATMIFETVYRNHCDS